jgi:GTPase SAR1 family protein
VQLDWLKWTYGMTNLYEELELINESDVEQKFLYKLLTTPEPNGLGLDDKDFVTKPNLKKLKIEKGPKGKLYYPDYAIIIDGVPIGIIEAKAPNKLGDAFTEARQYATEINASYPNKINPCELIIISDGISIHVGEWDCDEPTLTLGIENLNPTDELFYNLLACVSKRSLQKKARSSLANIKKSTKYYKPKHMLGGKSVVQETAGENSFGANISIEYKHLFNPVTSSDRKDIVENAYVASKRKQSHVSPIERIVRSAIPGRTSVGIPLSDTEQPSEIISKLEDHSKLINEVCLLVGSVGSGKSTFTDYLKYKGLPENIRKSTEWININLNNAPLNRGMIYEWIIELSIKGIKKNLGSIDFDCIDTILEVYKEPLSKVKKGRAALYPEGSDRYLDIISAELEKLQGDREVTLKELINYLKDKHKRTLIIVLDNCDKGNKDDQLLMFEVATWLRKEFYCVIFLPLRDTTYDLYKGSPPLDTVIKDLVFRIDPPLLETVIYSRLSYLSRELDIRTKKFEYLLPNGMLVDCSNKEIDSYMRSVVSSLFKDKFYKRVLVGLAGRNIRKGLEIVLDFCKSGHIPEDEILKVRQSEGDYSIPSHLVSKIIFKGNRKYYDDSDSIVKNLFHSYQDDDLPDPFVRISIMGLLNDMQRESGPNGIKGFHKTIDIIHRLQQDGHTEIRLFEEIRILMESGCIYSESQNKVAHLEDLIAISPSGIIHLELLKNINYLSFVAEDTLFRENQVAASIKDNMIGSGRFRLDSRQSAISSAKLLVDYLKDYSENYYLGRARLLEDSNTSGAAGFQSASDYVDNIASNDYKYNEMERLDSLYPAGSCHEAQVVSIQDYGMFFDFGTMGSGLILKSKMSAKKYHSIEEGDWENIKVVSYSIKHSRFELTFSE